MSLEQVQLRLRLTNDATILRKLKKNKAIKTDAKGEYFPIQFDGAVYYFRPGMVITVGKTVGKAMIRSSAVIMGDDIDGEFVAAVEEIGSYELGQETAPEEAAKATSCPICKQNCHTLPRLARHLMTQHTTDRADLYPSDEKPVKGLDDAPAETVDAES